jgi:hypothetical protein
MPLKTNSYNEMNLTDKIVENLEMLKQVQHDVIC